MLFFSLMRHPSHLPGVFLFAFLVVGASAEAKNTHRRTRGLWHKHSRPQSLHALAGQWQVHRVCEGMPVYLSASCYRLFSKSHHPPPSTSSPASSKNVFCNLPSLRSDSNQRLICLVRVNVFSYHLPSASAPGRSGDRSFVMQSECASGDCAAGWTLCSDPGVCNTSVTSHRDSGFGELDLSL